MRNSKLTNSSLVGHLSMLILEVDNAPGAVEALCCRGIPVSFKFSFERDFNSLFFISRKDGELPRSLFPEFEANGGEIEPP